MRFVCFTLLLFSTLNIWAQNTVELEVEYFTDQKVADASMDTALLNVWHQRVMQTCENILRLERTNHDVMILVTLPKGKPANIEISSRTRIDSFKILSLEKRISLLSSPPRSKLADYSYLIKAKVNKGCQNPQLKFLPQVFLPYEKIFIEYEAANLQEKINLLQTWTREQVMPVLVFHQSASQHYSLDVHKMGEYLQTEEYLRQKPEALTTQNEVYWRAMNATERGDGIVYLSKVFMHIAAGDFDLAKRYMLLGTALPEKNSLVTYYYKQLDFRMEWLFDDLRNEILKGKARQQDEDFHGAELYFDDILSKMPKSAELNFEKYYSHSLLSSHRPPEEIIALWKTCKEKVFDCDPLFAFNVPAKSREEVYYLSLRQELKNMLEDKANVRNNMLAFADYAFDLKDYGIASHIYFTIIKNIKDQFPDRDVEAYYLFCMNEVRHLPQQYETEIIKNRLKKVRKERAEVMANSLLFTNSKAGNTKLENNKKKKGKKEKKADK